LKTNPSIAALFYESEKDLSGVYAIINKETKKQLEKKRLAAGLKVTNVAYTRIDYNKALVEFHLESEGKSILAQYLVTIKDKKIIEVRQVARLAGIIKA
jgi:hypothetical protein